MLSYCSCGRKITRLRKQVGRLRRRLARHYGRRKRPYRPPAEDTQRQVRLLEYDLRKDADAGFQAFARLAAERNRFRNERKEEEAA